MNDLQRRLANLSPAQRALLEEKLTAVGKPLPQTPSVQPKRRPDRQAALSFAQQRLWFLDQLLAGSPVYNIPTAFRLSGFLDIHCLEQSLNSVVARHEVLRTTIESVEGKPFQIVGENRHLELVTHDLSMQPEVEREAEALKLLAQEAQRPFNLARDLMLRATVITLTGQEHIFLVVMHHIASDGWSMGVLMRELSHFYESEISGCPSSLPELPIQYADYAEWQLEWLQGKVLNEQLDYWKRQLAGVPVGLDLPIDRPRPAVQTFRGASRQLELSPELTRGLKALSLREKASLFMTLLAAFQVLLFRHTGQDDIVLGSPIAGRSRGEVEGLIGFFVNTLALRTDLSGNPKFLELLHRVREVALEAYEHQDLPFERLVEDLQIERSLSHNPLFQVMFVLQNAPGSPIKLPGIQAHRVRLVTETAHFDLTMSITEQRPGLIARLSYSTDLFEDATIERMLRHFEVLLEGIVKQPRKRISDLPILKEAEIRQLDKWNQTKIEHSQDWDLAALFESQVDRTPDAVAVEFEGEALAYSDLNSRANQLAHLLKQIGVGPDVLVGLYMERSLETMVAVLGVLKAGGAYVPMDTAYPGDRLAFMLTDAHPRVVITQQRLRNRIPDQKWSVICLDSEAKSVSKQSAENLTHEALPECLAYVIYTSGSTGKPKGVAMTRQALVNLVIWQCGLSNSKEASRTLQFTSLSFDVSFQEIFSTWCSGGSLVLINEDIRRDSLALLHFLQEKRINRLFLPFIALEHMAEAASCDVLPSTLREVYTAGEQLIITPHILGLFEKLPECSLHNHYGPSESHVVTAYPLSALTSQWEPRPPIGWPIANCQVYILDKHLKPVPVGVAGELFIGGCCLARGYLDRPEFTAEKFLPNPFCRDGSSRLYKTGDLVRYLEDGRIEFLGRTDHQVKLRGFRIELGEIESVLTRHSGVGEAVVVLREDLPGDQRLVAYVVRQGEGSCEAKELRAFLSKSLPAHMLPSAYEFLEALPLTPSGKVDRRALPAVSGESGQSEDYLGPRDEIEIALVGIWEELLKTRPVGVRDNFFELGGHSLLATRLIARIEKKLGAKISLANLFQSPTIESLAQNLQEEERAKHASLMPLRLKDSKQLQVPSIQPRRNADQPVPLSFAQQRLWFIDRLLPGSSLYNIPMAVRLRGTLDIRCLRQSLEAVVRRHEVLRTTISDINGEPFQVVARDWSLGLAVRDLTAHAEPLREKEASNLLAEEAFHPFDLARDLMLRAMLVKLTEEEHVLLLVMHHVASDGWSLSVLMRELSHNYQSYLVGKEGSLEELAIQYADYAIWQREWLQGEVLEKQLSYWKQNLSGAPRVLELPTDRPRPAIQTFQGASQRMQLPPQLVQDLKLLCRREKATLFMTVLAAFQLLLSRYAGRDDIVVGAPIAGRNRQEAEDLIGFFVNTLVLRTDLSGDPTFLELLDRVREVALGAYAHQDVPFERLVDELQAERDLSHHSLVQVMFVMQNAPQGKLVLSGLDVSPFRIGSSQAKFDLTLSVAETDSGMTVALGYNTGLFTTASMERMLAHFRLLLKSITAHPEHRLSRLPLLTRGEWYQLRQWNDTNREYPRDRCLAELFEAQVERAPEAVAVVCEDRQVSYQELNRRANQLGHYLKRRGVGPEVRVGICMDRSVEMVVGLLGIVKAGGAYVPLDRVYPGERLNYMIRDAGMTVLLTEQQVLEGTLDAKIGNGLDAICLDRDWSLVSRESETNLGHLGTAETLAYIMYTSGSTGQPKGVGIPQRAVSRLVLETNYARLGEEEVLLQMAPTSFDASTFELWGALLHGSRCVLYPGGLPNLKTLGQVIDRHRVTTLWLTASLFNTVIDDAPEILRPIRQLLIGGEALSVTHVRQANERLPNTQIINGYGPTENTTFTCCHTIPKVLNESRSIPIGTAIANTQVYLLDRYLTPVPVGVVGELYTGGEGLARGYWGRADLTAERFVPNPFGQTEGERLYRTGDLARYLPDGSIEFIGRVDNQVKIRGFRIELGDIEAVLSRHSSVEQAVVICREHDAGKRLVACVVSRDRHPDEVGELRRFVSKKLPEYMLPSDYVFLDALPLTASGKVDRRGLPAASELDTVSERGYLAARNEVERELTKIWEELLGVERIGVRDNFFELGGHSLLATRLIARIEKRLGGRISLANLFQSPTIESLAEELQEQKGVTRASLMPLRIGGSKQLQAPTIQPRERAGQPALLSFAQQRLWFLDQLLPGRSPYNIPTAFRLSGLLVIDSLERSLNAVIRRHEVLRTVIESLDGKPFQIAGTSRPLELAVHDLSLRPEGEREAEASMLLTQQAQGPFDLARDLMLRATLIKLSEQEHILLLVMHHIASDGWSMGILMRELSQFYEAETSGHPSSLPELPIQYADYAEWQLEWLQGKVLNEQLDYWKHQLAGVPTHLDLPTDRPRPAVQTFRGASRQLELSPELTQRLNALSVREKASLFMTLLAAFQVLLLRYTGQEDIVVGSPIAGRNRGEVEELIGFFVNTLALRTDLSGDPTFLDVLRRVKEVALKAYEYQDLPFERLVEDLQSERSLSHNPLFQVMFVLQNAPSSPLKLSGLQASTVRLVAERAHFDLTLSITERRQRLTGRLSYSTDLFEEATIKRMLGHLEVLLEGIVKRPEERISRLPLLTREEWSQLRQWNETRREYPRDRCIQALFEEQVERTPQSVALAFGNEQLKYDELNRRANQLAHYLRATGVGPEVLVGVYLERSVQQIVALLGILKAGGAYLPLDSTYPKQRLTFMLNDAGASVLLTERRFVAKLPSDRMKVLCLDEIGQALSRDNTQNPQSGVRGENLVYVIYTSGSTGQPKGIAVTHQAVVRLVVNTDYVQIEPGDVVAQVSNSSFDAATFEIWGALLHGARLVGLPKDMVISPEAFASSLVQQRISVLFLTTALFNQVSREKPAAFATVRHLLFGGETVEPRCVQDVLRDHPPGRLLHVYGPTETTTFASWYLVTPPLGQSRTIPIGQPIANTQLHILDRWLQPVPVGVAGEIYVGGDGLARGYLNRPELTAEKFVPDPLSQIPGTRVYRTGDLARFLPDGSIEFVGRIDNQVKIRGLRIELGEIEFVLKQHETVRDAVVAVRQDDEGEKRLVGYVVVRSERSESSRKGDEIREFLRARLPDYMVPGSFVELENLPLTSNGKIDHAALLAASESNMRAEAGYVGGRDEVERKLIRIWEELLHVRPIGVKDNFFDLGGHSLLATRLIARIEKTLGSVSLSILFQSPTIESLARELRQKKKAQGHSALVLFRNGGSRPPLFVHGGSFELSRYLGEDQPCYGIRPHGQDGRRAPATVEEMAADYLKEIRGVQPQGPYLIGGFSFGGLVAYEMAQQLRQSGQEVGLLVLIDPTPPRFSASVPQHPGNGSIARPSSTLNRHMTALRQSDLKPLVAALRSRSQRLANALKMRVCHAYLSFGQRIPSNLRMFYFFEVSGDAARSYVPRSYQGRAVLLSSQPNAANLWRNLVAGTLEVHELQGHHLDAIKGPRVELWARQLRSSLNKALR